MKVLIAEDDVLIREGLIDIFEDEGYEIAEAANGREALELYSSEKPDFICLDIMMPEINGYEVCKEIRKTNPDIPIIFLSAKSQEEDKLQGFDLGADDYITKPFGIKEVIARVRAVTRRCLKKSSTSNECFKMAKISVNPKGLTCTRNEEIIELGLRDIKILQYLHSHANEAISRQQLFQSCWGMEFMGNTRSIDQKISQLRKLIEDNPQEPKIIQTAHGVGYIYKD
ncbi:response regulator transcription factor [Lentisphaera profundi]|uniref:Response regulator transcription factor n=1 Tax=Lentisphaera profundi TaxID=1658616 RepID=A0ABY7W028_9BACT|nr:response regulator transcription factor [Lentisphaera profundi]WDE97618.1 response regulator transcription factor [Lentisphaera profundi]